MAGMFLASAVLPPFKLELTQIFKQKYWKRHNIEFMIFKNYNYLKINY